MRLRRPKARRHCWHLLSPTGSPEGPALCCRCGTTTVMWWEDQPMPAPGHGPFVEVTRPVLVSSRDHETCPGKKHDGGCL